MPTANTRCFLGRNRTVQRALVLHLPSQRVMPSCTPGRPLGTFGEAFKAGGVVLKLVPMEGACLVNGEPQKRADEILAEVSVTLTLSRLNGSAAEPG